MELQSTALQGIVKSSHRNGLFYLLPIQNLSTLQDLKGHLTTSIDVLSNLEEQSMEHRLDAACTLKQLRGRFKLSRRRSL